jgi:ribonuclease HII
MIKLPHPSSKISIGIDEVGRGAIAGPLVVCALYHPDPRKLIPMGAKDSKDSTKEQRKNFFVKLTRNGQAVMAVQTAEVDWINQAGVNTSEAQKVVSCIYELVNRLEVPMTKVIVLGDGDKEYGNFPLDVEASFRAKADTVEPLVMAASMVAKFLHDDLLDQIALQYPDWKFESHRGYASPHHIQMLYDYGLLPVHRTRAASKSVFKYAIKRSLQPPSWLNKGSL